MKFASWFICTLVAMLSFQGVANAKIVLSCKRGVLGHALLVTDGGVGDRPLLIQINDWDISGHLGTQTTLAKLEQTKNGGFRINGVLESFARGLIIVNDHGG